MFGCVDELIQIELASVLLGAQRKLCKAGCWHVRPLAPLLDGRQADFHAGLFQSALNSGWPTEKCDYFLWVDVDHFVVCVERRDCRCGSHHTSCSGRVNTYFQKIFFVVC